MGQAMSCSTLGRDPNRYCVKGKGGGGSGMGEKETDERAEERRERSQEGDGEWAWRWGWTGKAKVARSLLTSWLVLPIKTPLWGSCNPPTKHQSRIQLLSKKMRMAEECFMEAKIETSRKRILNVPTSQNDPSRSFQLPRASTSGSPIKLTPFVNSFHNATPKLHHNHSQCICW